MNDKKKNNYTGKHTRAEEAYHQSLEADMVVGESQEQADTSANEGALPTIEAPAELSELEKIQSQAREYLEGWQRAQAEFANFRKRMERDQALQRQEAVATAVRRYLPILDDLERALKNVPEICAGSGWDAGIQLIYDKMKAALEADGVKPIGEVGDLFDPNLHEAIAQAPSQEYQSGHIIEVLQKGYQIGERLLRAAIVRVAQ